MKTAIVALGAASATVCFMLGAVITVSEPGQGQGLVIAAAIIAFLSMLVRP